MFERLGVTATLHIGLTQAEMNIVILRVGFAAFFKELQRVVYLFPLKRNGAQIV
jgi:hypothetical protein